MDTIVKYAARKSLSSTEIRKLCDGKVRVISYPELANYASIDEALGKYGAMIVLYETKRGYGHWVAVFRFAPGVCEFFDPYGMKPDEELKYIPDYYRHVSGQDEPHLSNLLQNSDYKLVVYNGAKLQKFRDDVNTCGRWCAFRVALRQVPLKQFVKMFIGQRESPDWLVTALTSFA